MNPEERYEALSAAPGDQLEALADRILATDPSIRVAHGPETASTPLRFPIPDAQGATAALGHVAVTVCAVEMGGARGDGVRPGRDLPGAVAAAVCDAEVERGGPLAGDVNRLCAASAQARRTKAQTRADLVAATRLGVPE